MSHLPWVLGTKLLSSAGTPTILKHRTISPAPFFVVVVVN